MRETWEVWQALAFTSAVACAVLAAAVFTAFAIRPVRRLGRPLLVLVVVLLASLAVLVPTQSAVALGLEVAILGLGLGIVVLVSAASGSGVRDRLPQLLPGLPAVALVVGGLVIETGSTDGLYWLFAGVAAAIAVAVVDAWLTIAASDD